MNTLGFFFLKPHFHYVISDLLSYLPFDRPIQYNRYSPTDNNTSYVRNENKAGHNGKPSSSKGLPIKYTSKFFGCGNKL